MYNIMRLMNLIVWKCLNRMCMFLPLFSPSPDALKIIMD